MLINRAVAKQNVQKITVLRLGHRKHRDKRITTHCCLVARALGAGEIVVCGEEDPAVLESVKGVVKNWGGRFRARYERNWRKMLRDKKPLKVHLTFYGLPLQEKIGELRRKAKRKKLLVIIGAEKVPAEVYKMCDYNVSVTSQPHSEVAALALFLHEYFGGKELEDAMQAGISQKARLRITPQEKGKKVESLG